VALERFASGRALRRADVVVFCRNMEPGCSGALDEAQRNGIPIVYDIDDNLLTLSSDPRVNAPERQALLRRYLQAAAIVRVYSPLMEDVVRELNPQVERVTPPVYLDLVQAPRRSETRTRIVYATSRIRGDRLADIVVPALASILDEYGDRVEIHFWGHSPPELKRCRNVYSHRFILDYEEYMRRFSQAGYDIGLAPGLGDLFHLCKTNLKFRDYGACRIAGIYSNTELYSGCVVHGVSGLLVGNTTAEWRDAIALLIDDPALRERIQNKAYEYVARVHSVAQFEEQWLSQIRRVVRDQEPSRAMCPRPASQVSDGSATSTVPGRPRLWSYWSFFSLVGGLVQKGPIPAYRSAMWFCRSYALLLRIRRAAGRARRSGARRSDASDTDGAVR
jgi:glycosyltransferase involved in cell wall biosynthesis